jgi:hypothetical protein
MEAAAGIALLLIAFGLIGGYAYLQVRTLRRARGSFRHAAAGPLIVIVLALLWLVSGIGGTSLAQLPALLASLLLTAILWLLGVEVWARAVGAFRPPRRY